MMGILPPGVAASDIIVRPGPLPPGPDPLGSRPSAGATPGTFVLLHHASGGMRGGGTARGCFGRLGGWQGAACLLLLTLGLVAGLIGLIWWNARSLFQADASRRDTDLALREAEAVYHSLVETLPQRIFRKDLAGRYTFGNGNFCRARGRPLSEWSARPTTTSPRPTWPGVTARTTGRSSRPARPWTSSRSTSSPTATALHPHDQDAGLRPRRPDRRRPGHPLGHHRPQAGRAGTGAQEPPARGGRSMPSGWPGWRCSGPTRS